MLGFPPVHETDFVTGKYIFFPTPLPECPQGAVLWHPITYRPLARNRTIPIPETTETMMVIRQPLRQRSFTRDQKFQYHCCFSDQNKLRDNPLEDEKIRIDLLKKTGLRPGFPSNRRGFIGPVDLTRVVELDQLSTHISLRENLKKWGGPDMTPEMWEKLPYRFKSYSDLEERCRELQEELSTALRPISATEKARLIWSLPAPGEHL